jgi:nuclear GTP-binding protein
VRNLKLLLEPKSKRVPVRLRNKIEKSSAAKQRKARKQAKNVGTCASIVDISDKPQNPEWRSKTKKDPGIPNLFPYKDRILQEIEEKRREKDEEAARRKELARQQKQGGEAVANTMEGDEGLLDEELLEEDSEDENSMQVVSLYCLDDMASLLKPRPG